jgi:hypothetical protein
MRRNSVTDRLAPGGTRASLLAEDDVNSKLHKEKTISKINHKHNFYTALTAM